MLQVLYGFLIALLAIAVIEYTAWRERRLQPRCPKCGKVILGERVYGAEGECIRHQ